jgi:hypothetical protein
VELSAAGSAPALFAAQIKEPGLRGGEAGGRGKLGRVMEGKEPHHEQPGVCVGQGKGESANKSQPLAAETFSLDIR